jgi:PEP-CTERM motif
MKAAHRLPSIPSEEDPMNAMKTSALLVAVLAAAATAMPVWSAQPPRTVRAVLVDHDRDSLTYGPAAVDDAGNPVQDGDFLIFRIPTAADIPVGNGIDDRTRGIFDFRFDPLYPAFVQQLSTPGMIISVAQLELVLTPRESLFLNDQIGLENGPFVASPEIGNQLSDINNPFLINGNSKLVTIDLRNYYSNEQLVNFLSGGSGQFFQDGRIIMTYGDDSIVSGAALTLTANVPEPASFVLASLGLVGLLSARRLGQASSAAKAARS